jgi:hypothetical protein
MYSAKLSWEDWSRMRTVLSMAGHSLSLVCPRILAEPGMLPGQKVPGEVLVQEFPLHQQLDHPPPQEFHHRLKPGERDVEERTLFIKATL